MQDNLCLSGGAEGADLQWGMTAGTRGDGVIHLSFRRHQTDAPPSEVVVLTQEQLNEADDHLAKANKVLRRKWPVRSEFVANLLRRNYYQIVHSEACYAVAEIDKDYNVSGGTGWAVQMFIDLHPDGRLFVFDQVREQWFQWKNGWCPIVLPPSPEGVWAGIGTRKLNPAGKQAIRTIMGWKKKEAQ